MITVYLQSPDEFGSELITEIKIRRPKAKDMMNFPLTSNPVVGDILKLAGVLSGQPPSVIEELDCMDSFAVCEAVGSFLQRGPGTGSME